MSERALDHEGGGIEGSVRIAVLQPALEHDVACTARLLVEHRTVLVERGGDAVHGRKRRHVDPDQCRAVLSRVARFRHDDRNRLADEADAGPGEQRAGRAEDARLERRDDVGHAH